MVGVRATTQQQTLTFNADAAGVAAALQSALASVGKVKEVDSQTGRISGKVKGGLKGWEESADIDILVTKAGNQTQVQVQTTHEEGVISMDGAAKTMDAFLQALQAQPLLAQSNAAGW